jgi:cell division initiation protein
MNPLSTKITPRSFETVKRGYDQQEVDRYLRSLTTEVEALEDELTKAKTKLATLEKRIQGDRDANTVVQTAFLAAAEAKSKLLEDAQERADQIIAAAEARARVIADSDAAAERMETPTAELESLRREAGELLAEAEQRLSGAESEARRIRARAQQEAEEIIGSARRDALAALREAAATEPTPVGDAREELHRITWMLKNLEMAVRDALTQVGASDAEFSLVLDPTPTTMVDAGQSEAGRLG